MIRDAFWAAILAILIALTPSKVEAQSNPRKGQSQTPPGRGGEDIERIELQKSALTGDLSLSLDQAIYLALERNPNLIVEKLRLEQAREKIQEERGAYDPLLNFQSSLSRKDNVVASRFYPSGLYVEQQRA